MFLKGRRIFGKKFFTRFGNILKFKKLKGAGNARGVLKTPTSGFKRP